MSAKVRRRDTHRTNHQLTALSPLANSPHPPQTRVWAAVDFEAPTVARSADGSLPSDLFLGAREPALVTSVSDQASGSVSERAGGGAAWRERV